MTTFSIDFSFQNLIFCNFHLNFDISHILSPKVMKSIPLKLAHQDLSNNFKGTSQFLILDLNMM
jgi:hypothetical protein